MIQPVCKMTRTVDKYVNKAEDLQESGVDFVTGITKPVPIIGEFVEDEKMAGRHVKRNVRKLIKKVRPCF